MNNLKKDKHSFNYDNINCMHVYRQDICSD